MVDRIPEGCLYDIIYQLLTNSGIIREHSFESFKFRVQHFGTPYRKENSAKLLVFYFILLLLRIG